MVVYIYIYCKNIINSSSKKSNEDTDGRLYIYIYIYQLHPPEIKGLDSTIKKVHTLM